MTRRKEPFRIPDSGPIEIRGLVIPDEWDETGAVTGVALSGFDDVHYLVRKEGRGRELVALLQETITVRGDLKVTGNRKTIRVTHYRRVAPAGATDRSGEGPA